MPKQEADLMDFVWLGVETALEKCAFPISPSAVMSGAKNVGKAVAPVLNNKYVAPALRYGAPALRYGAPPAAGAGVDRVLAQTSPETHADRPNLGLQSGLAVSAFNAAHTGGNALKTRGVELGGGIGSKGWAARNTGSALNVATSPAAMAAGIPLAQYDAADRATKGVTKKLLGSNEQFETDIAKMTPEQARAALGRPAQAPPSTDAKPTAAPAPDDKSWLSGIPNWGKGLGVGAGAGLAGYLAHEMAGEEEDPETGEKKKRMPWLGPAVGATALGAGAYALKGDRPWGDLLKGDFWKQSSTPLVLVGHRIKFAAIVPGAPGMPDPTKPVAPPMPQPPQASQAPAPPPVPQPPTAATPPAPVAKPPAPPAGAPQPPTAQPTAAPATPPAAGPTQPPIQPQPAKPPVEAGPTPRPAGTPTAPPADMSGGTGSYGEAKQQAGQAADVAQTVGTGLQAGLPGGGVAAAGGVAERLAQSAAAKNPQAVDENHQKEQIANQLAANGQGKPEEPGFWGQVMKIWDGLSTPMKILVGAGLSLGALSLLGSLSGSETFGGGTGMLMGLGGLAAAAYGAGAFDSDSPLRKGLGGLLNSSGIGSLLGSGKTVDTKMLSGKTYNSVQELAQDPTLAPFFSTANGALNLTDDGKAFLMDKNNNQQIQDVYNHLGPDLKSVFRKQIDDAAVNPEYRLAAPRLAEIKGLLGQSDAAPPGVGGPVPGASGQGGAVQGSPLTQPANSAGKTVAPPGSQPTSQLSRAEAMRAAALPKPAPPVEEEDAFSRGTGPFAPMELPENRMEMAGVSGPASVSAPPAAKPVAAGPPKLNTIQQVASDPSIRPFINPDLTPTAAGEDFLLNPANNREIQQFWNKLGPDMKQKFRAGVEAKSHDRMARTLYGGRLNELLTMLR